MTTFKRENIKKTIVFLREVVKEIFKASLVFYLIYYLINDFYEVKIIANYFDINILLIISIASGLLFVIIDKNNLYQYAPEPKKVNWLNYAIIILLAGLVFVFIRSKTQSFGNISYFLATTAGLISLFSSIYIFIDNKKKNGNNIINDSRS